MEQHRSTRHAEQYEDVHGMFAEGTTFLSVSTPAVLKSAIRVEEIRGLGLNCFRDIQ
jgi:hypothetical protein